MPYYYKPYKMKNEFLLGLHSTIAGVQYVVGIADFRRTKNKQTFVQHLHLHRHWLGGYG